VSIEDQYPPPAAPQGPQAYPPAPGYPAAPPPPQQGTSGLAIAGFILAFVFSPLGFILSLIAVFKTGAGKAKGRGLAIAGVIISVIAMGVAITVIALAANSTVADPGCVSGKAAILDNSTNVDAASLQKTSDQLKSAAAKAKHDDVKAAMTALASDYDQLIAAMKSGNIPDGLEAKLTADGQKIDSLCTVGS
jgi:hypothetical protein